MWAIGILLAAGLSVRVADASLSSVTPTPSQRNVALATANAFSVTWTVVRNNAPNTPPPGATVTSSQGVFTDATGNVLGTVPTVLSQTQGVPPPGAGPPPPTTFFFHESVQVPQQVVYRAFKAGITFFYYTRVFTDSGGLTSTLGRMVLNITGSAAAGFNLTRLSLRFDDNTALRVAGQGEKLHAYADVSFTGTGQLQAVWEIATPPSTQGEPVYQTLGLVRQVLAGGGPVRIYAPTLPTDTTGTYLLRLRVTNPPLPISVDQLPYIRYVVSRATLHPTPPQSLSVKAPAPGARLAKDTRFQWQAVAGAKAYQVELYSKGVYSIADTLPSLGTAGADEGQRWRPSGPPVAGVLVPGNRTSARLSALGDTHLKAGYAYRWRVLAIGADGGLVAVSPWREVHTP